MTAWDPPIGRPAFRLQNPRRRAKAFASDATRTGRSEDTPLVIPFRGQCRGLSRSALHDAIKRVFNGAAAWLGARGPEFADRADELERASAHWLRHTTGSHQADGGVDLRTVRDNLGHVSLTTTSLYLHEEEDKRHRETVARHKMDWSAQPPTAPAPPNESRQNDDGGPR